MSIYWVPSLEVNSSTNKLEKIPDTIGNVQMAIPRDSAAGSIYPEEIQEKLDAGNALPPPPKSVYAVPREEIDLGYMLSPGGTSIKGVTNTSGVATIVTPPKPLSSPMQPETEQVNIPVGTNLTTRQIKAQQIIEDDCSVYEPQIWHIFLPPFKVFSYLCSSYDKSYLFITSFIRTIIYIIITKLYYDYIKMEDYGETGFTILIILCSINLIMLFYVILKTQKYAKKFNESVR